MVVLPISNFRLKQKFMIDFNKVVSAPMQVKPLKHDQNAVYRLIECDEVDRSRVDEETGKPRACQPRRSLFGGRKDGTGGVNIFDPINRETYILQNVTGKRFEMVAGQRKEVPTIDRVTFERNGTKSIDSTQNGTYIFMERHPGNRDNPFRDKKKKPTFYRVNVNKVINQENEKFMIMTETMAHIKNADLAELKSIYSKLDSGFKREINPATMEGLRRDLWRLAQKEPVVVMRCSNDKDVKMRIQMMDAEFYNIITFIDNSETAESDRTWIFSDGKKICQIDLADNKIEGLIKFFEDKKAEGVKLYQKILGELKKVTTPNSQPVIEEKEELEPAEA